MTEDAAPRRGWIRQILHWMAPHRRHAYVAFGVAKVPETWVIDPAGIVRMRWAGMVAADQLGSLVQQERDRFNATGGAG